MTDITRFVDQKRHQIVWQWAENGEEYVFIQTLFQDPPYKVMKEFKNRGEQ
tara:strand:+ start:109 stop:261 length:153 start_codon:yes stop_codon:yes gene_type:complete